MWDANLLFWNAQAINGDNFYGTALDLGKTPAEGVWVEVVVTAVPGGGVTMRPILYGNNDNAFDAADPIIGQALEPIVAVGRYFFKAQSKYRYARLYADTSAAGAFTATAGIVSGPQADAFVSP